MLLWKKRLFPEEDFADKLVKPTVFVDHNCNFTMYINETYFSASY